MRRSKNGSETSTRLLFQLGRVPSIYHVLHSSSACHLNPSRRVPRKRRLVPRKRRRFLRKRRRDVEAKRFRLCSVRMRCACCETALNLSQLSHQRILIFFCKCTYFRTASCKMDQRLKICCKSLSNIVLLLLVWHNHRE